MGLGTFNPNGIFDTSLNPANLNADSFANGILQLFPAGSAPIYAFIGELGRTKAGAAEHGYFTKHMAYSKLEVVGALAAGATTLVVVDTTGVAINMVFQVPATRENVLVTAVTNTTTLEIQRAYGRVAAGVIADGAILPCVGNSHTESSNRPAYRSIDTVYVPNYTVITRNAWAVSNTARATMRKTGKYDNVGASRQDCMELHSTEIESNLIWGQAVAPAGSPLRHATQGIVDAIYQHAPDNVNTALATTSYSQLVDLTTAPFNYAAKGTSMKQRTVYCDSQAMKVFHDIGLASGQVTMTAATTIFGMNFTEFRTYKGLMRLVEHPLLTELAPVAGIAIILDLTAMKIAYMEGRDAKKEEFDGSADSTGSGIDAMGGSLLTEFATEFPAPPTFGIINGLTQGVA